MENLAQIQQQLQGIPDQSLQQALGQPAKGLGSLFLMLENSRRQEMRSGMNTGLSRPNNMREEMARGMYQPVPPPSPPPVAQGGIQALMPGPQTATLGQTPAIPQQASQPQGIGGLRF